jgi:hypothetical protein
MDFLTLCKQTALESGVISGLPSFSTVNGASGRVAQLVSWVADAWVDIQNERTDWLWMQRRFTADLTPLNVVYTPLSLGLVRVGAWDKGSLRRRAMSIYDPAIGKGDESPLPFVNYDDWMETYDFGEHDASRPTCWTISPQGEVMFGPTPDKAYKLRGGYRLSAQRLKADGDIPEMPEEYHRVIIAEAIGLMSRADEVIETLTTYKGQYGRLRSALVNAQTSIPSLGGFALA